MTVRHRGRHVFDNIASKYIEGIPQNMVGVQIYVDPDYGSDSNAGTSPNSAFATLAKAKTIVNALVDWAHTAYKINVVWVYPGVYDEYFLGGFYYTIVIGLGIRGTDGMAEIHPSADGGVFRSDATFLNSGFINMRFECDIVNQPIFDLGICNNSFIKQCEFALGANVAGVKAIDTTNCTHLTVEECDFESGQGTYDLDYAIYHRGGADKFAHNCRYRNNNIFGQNGGIYIASNCTASQAIAEENFINVKGTGIGIDGFGGGVDTGGQLKAVRNRIIIEGAGDAIHGLAAGNKLHNETNVNGSFAYETA